MKNNMIKFLSINQHKQSQLQSIIHNGANLKISPLKTKASQGSLLSQQSSQQSQKDKQK